MISNTHYDIIRYSSTTKYNAVPSFTRAKKTPPEECSSLRIVLAVLDFQLGQLAHVHQRSRGDKDVRRCWMRAVAPQGNSDGILLEKIGFCRWRFVKCMINRHAMIEASASSTLQLAIRNRSVTYSSRKASA